jgi:hypothetical protein
MDDLRTKILKIAPTIAPGQVEALITHFASAQPSDSQSAPPPAVDMAAMAAEIREAVQQRISAMRDELMNFVRSSTADQQVIGDDSMFTKDEEDSLRQLLKTSKGNGTPAAVASNAEDTDKRYAEIMSKQELDQSDKDFLQTYIKNGLQSLKEQGLY